jgi:osmotically-inducible protein OsmY
MPTGPEAPHYVAERIRGALAADPRLGELGIAVKIGAGRVHLAGSVGTAERRALIETIVRELLPDHEVHNDVTVQEMAEPVHPERLR